MVGVLVFGRGSRSRMVMQLRRAVPPLFTSRVVAGEPRICRNRSVSSSWKSAGAGPHRRADAAALPVTTYEGGRGAGEAGLERHSTAAGRVPRKEKA